MGLRRPGRRRRRDRAVERRADPLGPLDRRAARARQHRRAQAVGVVADRRRPDLGRDLHRGRAAAPACSTSSRTRPGEAAPIGDELVENPHVRRLNFTGSTGTGRKLAEAAGRQPQARRARARRLQPADRARRRRRRVRGQRDGLRRVPAPGPDLHVGAQDHRRARRSRTSSSRASSTKTNGLKAGDPNEHDTIIGPLINDGRARDGQAPRRRRREQRARRCSRAARPSAPATARRCSPTCPPDSEFAQHRDVRPGGGDRDRRQRRRGRRARQRIDLRALVRDHHAGRRPRASRSRGRSTRASSTSTTSPSATSRRCRSAASRTAASGRFGGTAVVDEFTELRWVTVQRGSHPFPF